MGEYVDKITAPTWDWEGKEVNPSIYSVRELVESKYDATMSMAENAIEIANNKLEELSAVIVEYTPEEIPDYTSEIPLVSVNQSSRPVLDTGNLDLDFPVFDKTAPTLLTVPTIDSSGMEHVDVPDELSAAVSYVEESYDTTLFTPLLERMLNDLQSGATGLSADVEQEIYDRASARQDLIDEKAERETLEFFSARGWDIPTGAMVGKLAELANESARNRTDLNGKIMIEQAELAQKNSQFIIQASQVLEAALRDFHSKQGDRRLDYHKAVALTAISAYSEAVKAYLAVEEANKANIEAQVEHLKGVVEYNKGLISNFAEEARAFAVVNEGKASRNKAITDVYESEVKGFDVEVKQEIAIASTMVESYKLQLEASDQRIKTAVANVDGALRAYGTSSQLRERIAEAVAQISMQAFASSVGSVNMSAGIDANVSSSHSEQTSHSESRSIGVSIGNDLRESRDFEE